MRSSRGITMLSLIATILIMIIITSITIFTTIQSYDQMKFETFKAELQEIQREVDKISSDYQLAKNTTPDLTYDAYFQSRFNNSKPIALGSSLDVNGVNEIVTKYELSPSQYTYYLNESDIKKYLGLSGIEKSIIIDFSTKTVYSIKGCKDPSEKDSITYYTLAECTGMKSFSEDTTASASTSTSVTATSEKKTIGSTTMYVVNLVLNRSGEGKNYNIKKAYYSKDGQKWVEVDYLGDCKYLDTSVSFVIYNAGTYYFRVEDTSGKIIASTPNTINLQ